MKNIAILILVLFTSCVNDQEIKKVNIELQGTNIFTDHIMINIRIKEELRQLYKKLSLDSLPKFVLNSTYDREVFDVYFSDSLFSVRKEIFSQIDDTILLKKIVQSSNPLLDQIDTVDSYDIPYKSLSSRKLARMRLNSIREMK